MQGGIPKSFQDLRASSNNNAFANIWNKLLSRLDEQRIVFNGEVSQQEVGNYRVIRIGTANQPQVFQVWSGYVQFANLRGVPGRVAPSGDETDYIDIDRDNGLVSYADGSTLSAWPEAHEIYYKFDLSPGDKIVY